MGVGVADEEGGLKKNNHRVPDRRGSSDYWEKRFCNQGLYPEQKRRAKAQRGRKEPCDDWHRAEFSRWWVEHGDAVLAVSRRASSSIFDLSVRETFSEPNGLGLSWRLRSRCVSGVVGLPRYQASQLSWPIESFRSKIANKR